MIHAFGDSFVVGDQDDFLHETEEAGHDMQFNERLHYLMYNVSFAALIAKELNEEFTNHAIRGSGNYPQIDILMQKILDGTITKKDTVLFGITTLVRDRQQLLAFENVTSYGRGPCMIDRELIPNKIEDIALLDHFYILSILENISAIYDVKIIKFYLFDNARISKNTVDFIPSNFVGFSESGTTLIDILNDTWDTGDKVGYHDCIDIPPGYEDMYTKYKHPSIKGHKKIANWFLTNGII